MTERVDDPANGVQSAASRPAVWGDVPPRNPDFTGREALLRNLRRQLTYRATALLPHTLHGLGGVGKTQLAVEYAYRYDSGYDLVWWVPAEQPALLRQSLTSLAGRLDLVQPGDVDVFSRLLYRTECRQARWRIVGLQCVYEHDTLTPALPGQQVPVDISKLAALRPSYRLMAYVFGERGYPIDQQQPGDDRPEQVAALYRYAFTWAGIRQP